MPRPRRADLADVPQHIIQRGNNRQPCFFAAVDYQRYLVYLREFALRFDCMVHAYVLMTNHVHLLVTPSTQGAVSRLMQTLGRHYVPYVNRCYERTGTLWEGRFKSSLVGSGRYLMACYRYIELNPVRARMVATPADYRWSSYAANALGAVDPLVTPHAEYLGLGAGPDDRRMEYSKLVQLGLDEAQLEEIRHHMKQQKAFGSPSFQAAVESRLCRHLRLRPRGRPVGAGGRGAATPTEVST